MSDEPRIVDRRKVVIEITPVVELEEGDGELYPTEMIRDPLERLREALRTRRGV